jgi:cytochrome c-type biogenesis protein CcsB
VSTAVLSDVFVDATMITWAIAVVAFAYDAAFGTRSSVAVAASAALVGSPAGLGAEPAADGPATPDPADTRRRALGIGWATFVLGTVLLGVGVVARGLAAGRWPWGNMYEFALVGALAAAVAVLLLRRRADVDALMVWVAATLLLTVGLAITVLYVPAGPLVPALRSPWLVIHVLAAVVSAAVFTVAMVASALFLVRDRAERLGRTRGRYVGRLPAAATLDRVAYRVVAFGFPIWTFAVIAGAIWAEYAWGRYWGWDPKEVWALITWIVYAAYLHARTTAGWRGRRAAVIALVGYLTLLFNFFGVNIFFVGLHSYGGL